MSAPQSPFPSPAQYHALIATEAQCPTNVWDLYRFRKQLFIDRCGWMLPTTDGVERDQFDVSTTQYCLLYRGAALVGGFRAIRCDKPYLSKVVFAQLASKKSYPVDQTRWEISRFGVMSESRETEIGRLNYALMFRFARLRGAHALVAMADLTYERFLKIMQISTERYGDPQVVGFDRTGAPLTAVAGEIPMDTQINPSIHRFLEWSNRMEITDVAHVLGRATVSA